MIIKLCNSHGSERHIERADVSHYLTDGRIRMKIVSPKHEFIEVVLGPNAITGVGEEQEWQVAYIMENGRTVDTIRAPERTPTPPSDDNGGRYVSREEQDEAARITAECQAKLNRGRQR